MDPARPRLHAWWRPLVYAAGNLGKSVVWTTSETFLLIHLVTLIDFAPATAGALMAVILAVEGLADIVIAQTPADRSPGQGRGRRGGRSPSRLLLVAAPLCGVSFWLVFADLGLDRTSHVAQVVVALLVCRCCYTLCDVAHNALIIRLAQDPAIAATIAGTRLMFSAAGAALVGAAAAALVRHGWGSAPAALTLFAGAGGLLYALLVPAALLVGGYAPELRPAPSLGRRTLGISAGALLCAPGVRTLLYLVFLQACAAPLLVKMLPFVSQPLLRSSTFAGTAIVTVAIVQGGALPYWTIIARRLDVWTLLAIGHGLLVLSAAALAAGMAAGSPLSSGIAIALFGIAQAALSVAIWACLPAVARTFANGEAGIDRLLTGLFLAALKWGSGIGTGVLSLLVAGADQIGSPFDGVLTPAITISVLGSTLCLLILRNSPSTPKMTDY